MSKATWKFISAFYKARWDLLVADIHNNTFRQKVSYCYEYSDTNNFLFFSFILFYFF